MSVSKSTLDRAAEEGLLSSSQVEPLHAFLTQHGEGQPKFDFTHALYYLGGLIAIGALT